jgi:hypothetical protein
MLTVLTLLVAVLALLVSAVALAIAWSQLRLQRDAAGGRGLIFTVKQQQQTLERLIGVKDVTAHYEVTVKLLGNERDDVSLHLVKPPDVRPCDPQALGIEAPRPIRGQWLGASSSDPAWSFDLAVGVARDLWCVLSWVEPYGDGIRTCGFRQGLSDDDPRLVEEWRWFRFMRARRRIESWGERQRWALLSDVVGKQRKLGYWRPYRLRPLKPCQGPIELPELDGAFTPDSQPLDAAERLRTQGMI